MANDFDPVAKIIEYWRFENDLTASKNPGGAGVGHDLTASAGGVAYSAAPKEGSFALDLENSSNQWASITDANLLAGFPLKSGDAVKKISIAFWAKPESLSSVGTARYVISKMVYSTKNTLAIEFDYNDILVGYGYGTTGSEWWAAVSDILVAGRWYHVGLAVDGVAKTALCRVYDDTNDVAVTATTTFVNTMSVTDAPFVVGNRGNLDTSWDYDGLIDEVVVANDLLTEDEFDAIRQGTFNAANPAEMACASTMDYVGIAGDYIYQPFIIF